MKNSNGTIRKVSGPLVVASGMRSANMFDVVRVSRFGLIGEIIEIHGDLASIQVYEETSGLGPGEEVASTGSPLSVELGPGLIGSIYDGIQRPLDAIKEKIGVRLERGVRVPSLDREKKWMFIPACGPGDRVSAGDVLGTVRETSVVLHKILVPPGCGGELVSLLEGEYDVTERIGEVRQANGACVPLTLMQTWPVRKGRPYAEKLPPNAPLITGQRVIDTFFPVMKGGTAAVPGPFGAGKTIVQHQLAKWSNVDIVVYIGCGERGNEMTDIMNEFPKLIDPVT
ncbi:MAG: V-type ATP synthase subunit A, partial [Clostridia bacterium]|nr:V-type ATP synthase subunit A [Clostridia bacterium]